MKTTCTLAALLALAACDTAEPIAPPATGPFSAVVLDEAAAPALPPFSINQAVALDLRLVNDTGSTVRVERSCGGARADVQKEEGGAWRTVGTTGCDDEDEPLAVADGDSTEVDALFFVGGLDVEDLAGTYRLVLHAHEADGGEALPETMRTTNAFEVEEAAPFPEPAVFAPGLVSTGAEEYRVTFTPDGRRAYFARGAAFFPFSRQATIYETRREGGAWTAPVAASFSGTYPDIDPFVTPDGERLYFSSIRPVDGTARTDADVWYVEWTGGGWGEPVHTGAVNSPSDELYPSVAADGTLYVGSDRPGGLGGWDVYRAVPASGGGYGAADNVGAPVNTAAWEFNPVVSADGQVLLFTGLNYPDGAGFGDLYTSARGCRVGDAAGGRRPREHGAGRVPREPLAGRAPPVLRPPRPQRLRRPRRPPRRLLAAPLTAAPALADALRYAYPAQPIPAMAQICVPLPPLDRPRAVDVELTIDGVRQSLHYRVETLLWAEYEPLSKVNALQAFLDRHDPAWQLASIGVPSEESVPVLFRYRPRPMTEAEAVAG